MKEQGKKKGDGKGNENQIKALSWYFNVFSAWAPDMKPQMPCQQHLEKLVHWTYNAAFVWYSVVTTPKEERASRVFLECFGTGVTPPELNYLNQELYDVWNLYSSPFTTVSAT